MRKRRNKRLRKKGLSAVVTTLVIILLVLVSTGTIWVVIKNLIIGGVEEISLGKFSTDLSIKSVKVEGETLSVGIERAVGKGDLVKLKFIFENGTDSEIIERETDIEELDEKSFIFSLGDLSLLNIKKVSIVPIYESSSGKEVGGDIIDIFNLKKPIRGEADTWEYIGNFEKLGFSGAGREEYSISSQSEDIVKIKQAIVDPVDVLPGFNQTFTVHVYSPNGVVSVTTTTELDNSTLNLDLQEIGEEGGDQIFSATWVVNDVHTTTYRTHITATDSEGNSDSVTLTWTDACQALIAFSDHGVADKTISQTCTTAASSIGGVDGSNIIIAQDVNLIIAGGSQFIFNQGKSITITASGASITNTGSGSFGNGDLYYTDADGDGYASGEALLIGSGTGRVRASDASIVGINDCADASGGGNNLVYQSQTTADDTDQDRWSTGATVSRCVGVKSSYWYRDTGGSYKWITSGDRISAADCNTGNTYVSFQATGTNIDNDQDGWQSDNSGSSVDRCIGGAETMITIAGRRYYNSADNTFDYQVWSDRLGDNDCNDGSNVVQLTRTKYKDVDGDGYTETFASFCASASTWGNSACSTGGSTWAKQASSECTLISALSGVDCYDSNANAKPGQTAWYSSHRGDGSYDYNCVSGEQKRYTDASAFCGNTVYYDWEWDCSSVFDQGNGACGCVGANEGWVGSTPACGVGADYVSANSCPDFGPGCPTPRTQQCH